MTLIAAPGLAEDLSIKEVASPAEPQCCPAAQILVVICTYNEAAKIEHVLDRLEPIEGIDLLVVDDGCTDATPALVGKRGITILRHERQRGAGASLRTAIHHFLEHDYDTVVFIAGNNKDEPREISRLVEPILRDELDVVQGSRYLPGGHAGNMPRHRGFATRYMHPRLFSWFSGRRMTDTTNGFRAIRREVLEDPRLDLEPAWLDEYELEPYLLFKAIRLGWRVGEVPVSKIYPPKSVGYTKMKPITGWWSILSPLFLLGLGLRD